MLFLSYYHSHLLSTVTGYSPTSVGLPLIVLVSGSYVTPSGKPLTSFVTGFPLLSSPLIVIVSIGVFTFLGLELLPPLVLFYPLL